MRRYLYLLSLLCAGVSPDASAQDIRGLALFQERCSHCHVSDPAKAAELRVPDRASLTQHTPEHVLEMITTGAMAPNAKGLTEDQLRLLAEVVALRPFGSDEAAKAPMSGKCENTETALADPEKSPSWNGWSPTLANARFQQASQGGITANDIGRLRLKWAFGYPGGNTAFGQPSVVSGRIFVGNNNGFVYSLDARTGCYYWAYEVRAAVRTAISVGKSKAAKSGYAAYFGDLKSVVHAVDAVTGAPLWSKQVDTQPFTRITAAPVLAGGRLIVGISSQEEMSGAVTSYECCTFRGKLLALNPENGKAIWTSFTIPTPPQKTRKNVEGVQQWGPSGASIWSAPTVDLEKKVIYVTTSDSYSAPTVNSDAIIAFDFDTGRMLWVQQVTKNDVFVVGCGDPDKPATNLNGNCPDMVGPDVDFGGSAILHRMPNGKKILLASQKSGIVWGIDPDRSGAILWNARVGRGGAGGGVVWGAASDDEQIYASVFDFPGRVQGGISAIKIATGEVAWRTPSPLVTCETTRGCSHGQPAALTAAPGVVFSGSYNGLLRGYSTIDGHIMWEFDTRRPFKTVNGVSAKGGSLNGPGPVIVDGMMFLNSGYGSGGGVAGEPGNVLLAFDLAPADTNQEGTRMNEKGGK